MQSMFFAAVPALRTPPPMMQVLRQPVAPAAVTRENNVVAADAAILVQGSSLRTWSYRSPLIEKVQVLLSTEGRPLDADVELWQGPDNTPVKMRVHVENGQIRPVSVVLDTPRGPNTVAVRNTASVEFPIAASVVAEFVDMPSALSIETIQGGSLRTFQCDPSVDSVECYLNTDGRPLNARIELLQGPDNIKQTIELYTEDGFDRPFFCFLATPGAGNVVRIVNTATVEYPLSASVVPHGITPETATRDSASRPAVSNAGVPRTSGQTLASVVKGGAYINDAAMPRYWWAGTR